MEVFENIGCHFEAACFVKAGINQGESNIFDNGKIGDEVKVLEDKTDLASAKAGFFTRGNASDGFAT